VIRLLFVDDDRDVLEGLENRLSRHRDRFYACYAESGREALTLLASEPFDAVVSDMRMPGMNGAELLGRVREAYPGLVRIILSGEVGREGWLEAERVAHQTLSKPCDVTALGSVLEEVRRLGAALASRDLAALLGRPLVLPTPTWLMLRLDQLLANGDALLASVAAIVEQDAALTARVLRVTNSAYFAGGHRCQRGLDAVRCLGLDAVRALTLTHELYGQLSGTLPHALLEALHTRAQRTAAAVRVLSDAQETEQQQLVTAAILQDVGGLALLTGTPPWPVERTTLSGYLLALWGLPEPLVRIVANAGRPSHAGYTRLAGPGLLHLAQVFVGELETRESPLPTRLPLPVLDRVFCASAGLDEVRLASLRATVQSRLLVEAP
jgi:HD-like signal output (HDOD) protein